MRSGIEIEWVRQFESYRPGRWRYVDSEYRPFASGPPAPTPVPRCAIRTRCSPPVRRTHARLRAWWEPRGRTCNGVGNAR